MDQPTSSGRREREEGADMKVIEARGLTKEYRGRAVVDQLSMTVNEGDIYGFVGKNGAGKSTVMKMICGLVAPTAGDITLFGSAPSAQPTARGRKPPTPRSRPRPPARPRPHAPARPTPSRPTRRAASACSSRSPACSQGSRPTRT